ncbi:MAG: ATP-binding protein [Steroidobacterales bacterium]
MYTLVQPPNAPSPAGADAGKAMHELLLSGVPQGIFALDANDAIVAPLSPSLGSLFRRSDLLGIRFEDLLQPIVPKKFLAVALQYLAAMRASPGGSGTVAPAAPLELEVRFAKGRGASDLLYFLFEFTPISIAGEPGTLLVRVTDHTTALLQTREIEDLHLQLRTQSDILQTLLRLGNSRYASILRSTDIAMNSINEILRRPAREQPAFRSKLEQTLVEVDRIGRNVAATNLASLIHAARQFESALLELRDRPALSGNDFLPLAVKLDELYVQFSLVQSLSRFVDSPAGAEVHSDADGVSRPRISGSDLTAEPKLVAQLLERHNSDRSIRSASAGTLAHTFARLTENAAEEEAKPVVLRCSGMDEIPPGYQSTVKNIVIQFIRNAVQHGIESGAERATFGKPRVGQLKLEFTTLPDGSFEMSFEDDGRGIDPDTVREIAVSKAMITPGMARHLGDRQALKMIFKTKFTTLPQSPGEKRHGAGLAFVRRYVHDAGGVISLGSEPGRSTRFKISLPPIATASATPSGESHDASRADQRAEIRG